MTPTVFLPGASGRRSYWQPVAEKLRSACEPVLVGWPGFDGEPAQPRIECLSDLPSYILRQVDEDYNVVAQSMGGVVALLLALRQPPAVRRLVLCGTSGGIDLSRFDLEEWRPEYLEDLPEAAPRWFVDDKTDLTPQLSLISQPALLLWGEDDRVSTPAIGRHLAGLLPNASFELVAGAGHMLAEEQPDQVADAIGAFLCRS